MTVAEIIWKLLYLGTAINIVLILWLFARSKNGIFRRAFLAFFGSLIYGLSMRILVGFGVVGMSDIMAVVVILPIFLASGYLGRHLHKTYQKQ